MTAVPSPRPLTHVIFDFDGTLSWLRHGWPHVMLAVMREQLPPQPGDSEAAINAMLLDLIISLNGHATIKQFERFAEVAKNRNGRQLNAEALRQQFQARLDAAITQRINQVASGQAKAEDFVVFAARPLLEWLRAQGLTLAIVSSTVEERVREEAALLGLTDYFGERIYGCVGDPQHFSKQAVFARIMAQERIVGANILSFGDGPVELAVTIALGGLAIAVCSDEDHNGSGIMDTTKQTQLLAAGAFVAIPDYRDAQQLVASVMSPS
jgi:phosphoglycolate phosphatase-like HAD superfamily hydrolase